MEHSEYSAKYLFPTNIFLLLNAEIKSLFSVLKIFSFYSQFKALFSVLLSRLLTCIPALTDGRNSSLSSLSSYQPDVNSPVAFIETHIDKFST